MDAFLTGLGLCLLLVLIAKQPMLLLIAGPTLVVGLMILLGKGIAQLWRELDIDRFSPVKQCLVAVAGVLVAFPAVLLLCAGLLYWIGV